MGFTHVVWFKSVLIIALIALVNKTVSQNLEFKKYSTKEGLLTDEVYNLHQDKKGYLWVFSRYGTLKYNGLEFKQVLRNLPFKDSFVYSIYENEEGRKWIANSNARIYEIRNDSAVIIEGIEEISSALRNEVSEIVKLYVDDSLSIYAITKGHSYKFIKKNNKYYPNELWDDMGSDCAILKVLKVGGNFLPVYLDKEEKKFYKLCDRKHIYMKFPLKKGVKLIELPGNYLKSSVRSIEHRGQQVYFTLHNFVYKINEGTGDVKCIKVNNSVILNTALDKNNHLWLGCFNDGLYELNEKDSVINHYFINTTINDMLIDDENSLWVSTPGSGLFQCSNLNYKRLENFNSPCLIKEVDDKLFMATSKGAVFFTENNKTIKIREEDGNEPIDLSKHGNNYYISFRFIMEKFNLKGNKPVKISTIKEPTVTKIITKNKDTLIYLWRRGIIFSVNGISCKQIDFGCKILDGIMMDSILLLGTETGVYKYSPVFYKAGQKIGGMLIHDKQRLKRSPDLKLTENTKVKSIVKDRKNGIWFCTEGDGLIEWNGKEIFKHGIQQGLPSEIVNNISFGDDHSALLSTNKGLYISKWNPMTGTYTEWLKIKSGEIRNALLFGNTIYVDESGGLVTMKYDPETPAVKNEHFNLALIQVDSLPVLPSVFTGIANYSQNLSFTFDHVTFNGSQTNLNYHLEGPSSTSGTTSSRTIRFDNLSPGNYTLNVYPDKKNGENLGIEIPFNVEPLYWQTIIFKVSAVFAIIMFIYVVIKLIVGYNHKKESKKIRSEQLLLEYKLIALKAQINPHFMSNCLSAIQDLILSKNIDKATYYVAQFGLLVRQILDFSSKQLISLKEELDLLTIYLQLEQLRFESKFVFKIHIEKDISTSDTYVPPLILNPIVENAIWHGLLPLRNKRRGEIHIFVTRNKENLMISIQDNGVGRDENKAMVSNQKGKSHGVKITQQRLNNINYLSGMNRTKLIFQDLVDEQKTPSGTQVTIYLPSDLKLDDDEQD